MMQTRAVRRKLLTDTAYDLIKSDIIRCKYQPGQKISEPQLSEKYATGRAAIRTALNRLSQDRLVVSIPREGYVISSITLGDVKDLFAARRIIEPATARAAAGKLDAATIERLHEIADVQVVPRDIDQVNHYLALATEFHVTICRFVGNVYIVDFTERLWERVERILHLIHLLHGEPDPTAVEHPAILDALVVGDADLAESLMKTHLDNAERFVFDALYSSPSIQLVNLTAV